MGNAFMNITFTEHGEMIVSKELRERIRQILCAAIPREPVTCYCGGYGMFDSTCAGVIHELKQEYTMLTSVFVTPYHDEKRLTLIKACGLYDKIHCPDIGNTPPRFAIIKRNEYMIDCADHVIAYVKNTYGGAYRTLQYAKRKKKTILNLAE